MKKLKLKAQGLGAKEVLTREQLKKILGGGGGDGSSGGSGGPCTYSCGGIFNVGGVPSCSQATCPFGLPVVSCHC